MEMESRPRPSAGGRLATSKDHQRRSHSWAADPTFIYFHENVDGKEAAVTSPAHEVNATPYDADCQDALPSHFDELLNRAEAPVRTELV